MKTPSVLLLAGALVLAGGAALLARALLAPPPPPAAVAEVPVVAPSKPAVLVASRDLRPGQLLDRNMLDWVTMDLPTGADSYYVQGQADIGLAAGAVLHKPVAAGQPLPASALLRSGEAGFVAAVLRPGMRAVSLPTSAVAVSQGLVSAGDRVDVILALRRDLLQEAEPSFPPPLSAQTLLRDVRVLALNRSTRELTVRGNREANADPASAPREPEYFDSVTVEVTPGQAERLALSKEIGVLQLSLRSVREPSDGLPRSGTREVTRLTEATAVFPDKGSRDALMLFRGDRLERIEP